MGELPFAPIMRFAAYARRPDDDLRLDVGALLVAELRRPRLEHARYLFDLDGLAAEVWAALGPRARLLRPAQAGRRETALRVLETMVEVLSRREDFHGAEEDIADARCSFLDSVLTRRDGLPARFMVKWPLPPEEGGDLYVDVYDRGALLDEPSCHQFILRMLASNGQ